MSKRLLQSLGVVAAGGAGYYLYTAGGNPKVAEKMAEHDAARASAKVKSSLPGAAKEAKLQSEEWAARAGSTVDSAVAATKGEIREFDGKVSAKMSEADRKMATLKAEAESKFKEAQKDAKKGIDDFDKTVERKAAEAKSGLSSWFGFGK